MAFQGTGERITEAQAKMLSDAIRACEYHLAPAGPEFLAVQLDKLFEFAAAFGINADRAKAAKFYAPLANLPRDLLAKAVDAAISRKTDSYRPPLPAEIEATVADDLALRRRVMAGLQKMKLAPVERRTGRRTPEEIARVDAEMAKVRAALAQGGAALRGQADPSRNAPNAESGV
ncbi:MAG: hypothetical protein ING29_12800 [Azospirillum sp.]|nr:hypothetical protein [Azospirillum sp.]